MTKTINSILLVEDVLGDARLIREMVREHGGQTKSLVNVTSMSEAEAYLEKNDVDIILLDLGLPDAQGLGAIRRVRNAAPHVP